MSWIIKEDHRTWILSYVCCYIDVVVNYTCHGTVGLFFLLLNNYYSRSRKPPGWSLPKLEKCDFVHFSQQCVTTRETVRQNLVVEPMKDWLVGWLDASWKEHTKVFVCMFPFWNTKWLAVVSYSCTKYNKTNRGDTDPATCSRSL